MIEFSVGGEPVQGYCALPGTAPAPGVLVLHAWWGLTPTFTNVCDRLAAAGFAAFAPDLYRGKTATTIEEAEHLLTLRGSPRMQATAFAALDYLRTQPEVRGRAVATLGFSLGAGWAIYLSSARPADVAATVFFYGTEAADFAAARAAYLGHFATDDAYEPLDGVRQMEADMRAAGRAVTFQLYPGTEHWFAEPNRPEYNAEAAELAWSRTIAFLEEQLEH